MKEFDNAYKKVLSNIDSRVFYEYVTGKDVVEEVSIKDFYSNVVKFYIDDEKYSIIFDEYDIVEESHEDTTLQKRLYSLMFDAKDESQIHFSDVFSCISNKLKSEYSLEMTDDFPIYVFKFDFKKPSYIYRLFKSFGVKCKSSKMKMSLSDRIAFENELFKEEVGDACGLYFNGGNAKFLFLNENEQRRYSESIINHEVFHMIQDMFGIHISLKKRRLEEIPELGLSKKDLMYLYKPDEFEVHMKIDLIDQLEEAYWKFFKKETKRAFIEKFIYQTRCSPTNIYENEVNEKIIFNEMKHSDLTPIRLFYSTFIIKDKSWNKLAIEWLRESFK